MSKLKYNLPVTFSGCILGPAKVVLQIRAMINSTGRGNLSNYNCPWLIYPEPFFSFIFVTNIFIAITATLGNVLVLVALHKVSSIHSSTKLLLGSLAVADLGVGLIVQPLYLVLFMGIPCANRRVISLAASTLTFALSGFSFHAAAAICVDRLLALLLRLRYRQSVTLKRVCVVITCLWLASISEGIVYSFYSPSIANSLAFVGTVVSVLISVSSYAKIVLKLRRYQAQVQHHVGHQTMNAGGPPLNIRLYKNILYGIGWVQIALAVCYFPFILYMIMITLAGWHESQPFFLNSALTIVYFNSSLNPFLFCWKIREVRQTIKNIVKQILCFLS